MNDHFEATANFDDWPANVPGKPTQAAVFGVYHPTRGKCCQILWTAKFPDLEQAMYWPAKKEVQAVRKGKWIMASRVLWQHELTPEQAVEACNQQVSPQIDAAMKSLEGGGDFDLSLAQGPAAPVNPADVKGYYAEIVPADDDQADPIASFIAPPPAPPPAPPQEDDDGFTWLPIDPRERSR